MTRPLKEAATGTPAEAETGNENETTPDRDTAAATDTSGEAVSVIALA